MFRAGVELVSIDVTALDSNGRQVTDLTAAEFQVEIDGGRRQVSTVEYIRSADPLRQIGAPHKVVVADETFATSNAKGAPRGRLITLLIDQGNIRTGAARSAMNSAKKFVDTLTPEDRVSVVAVPGPGELVDFTTNHDKVREALLRIVGTADAVRSRFNLSISEALAIYMHSNAAMAAEVILRSCGALTGTDFERCEREVDSDAAEVVNEIRRRTQDSVHGMRTVLQSLAGFEGPKSVIVISEGLVFEGLGGETDDLAGVAADSRASIDVLLLDVPRFDAAQVAVPTTPRQDRDLQVTGLEQLAGASRGELYRINTTAEYAFDRISRALDGYYLLGVESRPEDRNGRRHRTAVKSAAARRDDPLAAQFPDVDLGESDDAGGRSDAGDSIALADQRSAAEGCDLDLQAAGHQQGPRHRRRRSGTARRPAARLHRRHGDREQAGPRPGAAGRVEAADSEGRAMKARRCSRECWRSIPVSIA